MIHSTPTSNHSAAQLRADRIAAFRVELDRLLRDGVLTLSLEQRAAIDDYHGATLEDLADRFDIDTGDPSKQLSLGMQIVSFLGALALSASFFFFFYRVWGAISTPVQVLILIAAPVLALTATALVARREDGRSLTLILATLATLCFVVDLSVLGTIFNLSPHCGVFLVWGAFALLLAYAYRLRSLLVAGLALLAVFIAAATASWSGLEWTYFAERPEGFLPAGALFFALPGLVRRRRFDFASVYRATGLATIFPALLALAFGDGGSYLPLPTELVADGYQLLGFIISALVIWLGVRRRWRETVYVGATVLIVFIYAKMFDWWWTVMARYLFFLILSVVAVLILLALGRLSRLLTSGPGARS